MMKEGNFTAWVLPQICIFQCSVMVELKLAFIAHGIALKTLIASSTDFTSAHLCDFFKS